MEHQNLFLMPLWRAIGKSKFIVQARTLPKTILVVIAVLVVILGLFIVPADFDLHAKGTLEPVIRKDVYAGVEGTIYEFGTARDAQGKLLDGKPIEHGSWVKGPKKPGEKGDLLLKLRNPTLEAQKAEIEGQVAIETQHVKDIDHELTTNNGLRSDDRVRLMGQLAEAEAKLKSLEAEAEIQRSKVAELEVYSPIDGQIVTWDLKNRLEGRPVQKGQALLRIANPEGEWELDLHMPEDRMGHIMRAKAGADEHSDPLQVKYILATEPGTTEHGSVKEIRRDANVQEKDEGNVVEILVDINKKDIKPENLREGATVNGKVHCGRASLGYVWFHDLFAFIQAKVFFRFF